MLIKEVPDRVSFHQKSHKSHNALDKYSTMHHFVAEMCTHVHISVTKWRVVGYGTGALWDCVFGLTDATSFDTQISKCAITGFMVSSLGITIKHIGPLLQTWISNCIDYNMRVEKLLIHFQISTVQPLKFGNGSVISSRTLLVIWLLIPAGIKVNPC